MEQLYIVTWFDYARDKEFTETITQSQLNWLFDQKHIQVDKYKKVESL